MTMKIINSKTATMMMALSFFLGAFKECYGASQLFGLESIVYEDTHGFPTTVAIEYESDLRAVDTQESASDNEFYFTYVISGSGASYYSTDESSLTVVNTGTIQIDLIENDIIPIVGIYTVSIRVEMMFKQSYGETLMHAKTYELTVDLQEATIDLEISNEGPFDSGDDIVCNVVETADTPYKVWLDTSNSIEVFSDYNLENKILDWPGGSIVATADNEDEATDSLAVTLQNIPDETIYNMETVYVKVPVMFLEVAGEALSTPHEESGGLRRRLRALQTNSEGSATLETSVILVPYDGETESTSNTHVQQQYSEGSATLGTMVSLEPYEEEIVSVTNTFALQRPSSGSADFVTTVHFVSDITRSSNNNNASTGGHPGDNRIQKVRFHSSANSSTDTTKDPLVVGLAAGVAAGGIALILLVMFFCHMIFKNQNESDTKDEGSEGDESTLDGSIADKASISSANNTLAEI